MRGGITRTIQIIDVVAIVRGERQDLQERLKKVWDVSSDLELEYETIVSPTVIPFGEYESIRTICLIIEIYRTKEWILLPDNREELMKYRLEMAEERLKSSKILLDAGSYKDSIGRSYYAMFTAVRALLAIDGQDFRNNTDYADFFIVQYRMLRSSMRGQKNF